MNCPHCGHEKSSVIETRRVDGEVWRQRRCHGCVRGFISRETTSLALRMPKSVTEASIARLRAAESAPTPRDTEPVLGVITSGFIGWGIPGQGATQ